MRLRTPCEVFVEGPDGARQPAHRGTRYPDGALALAPEYPRPGRDVPDRAHAHAVLARGPMRAYTPSSANDSSACHLWSNRSRHELSENLVVGSSDGRVNEILSHRGHRRSAIDGAPGDRRATTINLTVQPL